MLEVVFPGPIFWPFQKGVSSFNSFCHHWNCDCDGTVNTKPSECCSTCPWSRKWKISWILSVVHISVTVFQGHPQPSLISIFSCNELQTRNCVPDGDFRFYRETFDIRKPDLNDDDLLSVMSQQTLIRGLDLQRQWYLYENIRQHCH